MSQKKPKCDRSKFASQADYESCLEGVRVSRLELDDDLSMNWPEVRDESEDDDE